MKGDELPQDFTARVMREVRAWEAARREGCTARYLLPAGGILLWLVTVARLCLALFAPAVCR